MPLLRHPLRLCTPLAFAALLAAGAGSAQRLDPTVGGGIRIEQHLDVQVPLDLTFRDETGATVRLGDLMGSRPVVLTLAYYECPMLCTQVLNGLLRALRVVSLDVGRDFDVLTVSIDPGETPGLARSKKSEYVGGYGRAGAAGGWHFLTGEESQIARLADAVGFRYEYDEETDNYIHASGIMVLTPQGRVSRYYYGIEYSPKDLRLGLVEASAGRIGSPVDQILLLCFHYDPATGQYGLAIMNTLRLAGGLTVALLAVFVIGWIRRERGRHPAGDIGSNPVPNRN